MNPLTTRKIGGDLRLGRRRPGGVLEQQPQDPDRDAGADDQPGEPLGRASRSRRLPQRGEEGAVMIAIQSRQK